MLRIDDVYLFEQEAGMEGVRGTFSHANRTIGYCNYLA